MAEGPRLDVCPDCGADWPGYARGERCPGCLLSVEEIEAAAALFERLMGAPA